MKSKGHLYQYINIILLIYPPASSIIIAMANGEEDLAEKNKGRRKPAPEKRYMKWNHSFGEEDSEMLLEKSSKWSAYKESRGDYDDE